MKTPAVTRLREIAMTNATTYEQAISFHSASEGTKALAFRFCREFEPELIKLGYRFVPSAEGLHKAVWVSDTSQRLQDVIEVFNKSGISLQKDSQQNAAFSYCAAAHISIPRFGGPTSIYAMAYATGASGIAVCFNFFGN